MALLHVEGGRRAARAAAPPERASADAGRNPGARVVLQLQATAGNAAVAAMLTSSAETAPNVQRLKRGTIPPPPVPPRPPNPAAHLGLRAAKASLRTATNVMAKHPPPAVKAAEAAKAAAPPAGDKEAQAKEAKAGAMGAAPPGGFDKAAFVAAVKAAIDRQSPKTLEEADQFGKSGKSDTIAADVKGRVAQGKDAAAKPMAEASARPPDPSRATEKEVVPIPPEPPVARPRIDAAQAAPSRAPPEQTDLRNGPAETDRKMTDAGVTDAQLRNSNEPELTGALAAKQEAEQHSATAAGPVREREAATLAAAKQDAGAAATATASALLGARTSGQAAVTAKQQQARSKDEQERADVTKHVTGIFDATKNDVDNILKGIDPQVDQAFTSGEATAKKAFTDQHTAEMKAFRDQRYSYDMIGAAKWAADLLLGPEPEVDRIFQRARVRYETEMTKVINAIADLVGRELALAKERVAKGRADIDAYVKGLKPSLQKVGADAAKDVGGRFDDLVGTIDEKGQALAEDLASKYVEARNAVDDEIKKMQEENKGLVDQAKDAVGGAIETILKLKDMLLGVLARASAAVEKIIKDPIAFLGNLVNAVKGGIVQFGNNILTHLKTGLQTWLFGALSDAGIELPEKFDLKGVLQLVLSILGLTWASIRAKIAAKLPPGAIEFVEQGFNIVQILIKEGVGGLWRVILEKVGDIKEMVLTQVKEMVSIEIVKAGIVWLISLLNPASAFVKACKMIYDVVMFFVEKADQIKAFVDSILDSVESIAAGGVGAVAGYIEKTLGRMVPVLIGFLASLLGLGGISGKIKKILETIQKPVNKAIDWVIGKAVAFGKRALALGKKLWNKVKEKGKAAFGKLKKKLGIKEKTPEEIAAEKEKRLDKGLARAFSLISKIPGAFLKVKIAKPILAGVKLAYRMTDLKLVPGPDETWDIFGEVNPAKKRSSGKKKPKDSGVPERLGEVAAYSSFTGRAQSPLDYRRTEAEHVIPRAYVDAVLKAFGDEEGVPKTSSIYKGWMTVLTYESAATLKGRSQKLVVPAFPGGKRMRGDRSLTQKMLNEAVRRGEGDARLGLPDLRRKPGESADDWEERKADAAAKAQSPHGQKVRSAEWFVMTAYPIFERGALTREQSAVSRDFTANRGVRDTPQDAVQTPSSANIEAAWDQQKQQITELFQDRGIVLQK